MSRLRRRVERRHALRRSQCSPCGLLSGVPAAPPQRSPAATTCHRTATAAAAALRGHDRKTDALSTYVCLCRRSRNGFETRDELDPSFGGSGTPNRSSCLVTRYLSVSFRGPPNEGSHVMYGTLYNRLRLYTHVAGVAS